MSFQARCTWVYYADWLLYSSYASTLCERRRQSYIWVRVKKFYESHRDGKAIRFDAQMCRCRINSKLNGNFRPVRL